MKGDITRSTFRPARRFQSVLMQQGRVQLDADWNEQVEIQRHLDEVTRREVVGPAGVPNTNAGFGLSVLAGPDLAISDGNMYVDGQLCELGGDSVGVDSLTNSRALMASALIDGREVEVGDWVMLSAPGESAHIRRATAVNVENRRVDFVPALGAAATAALLAAGPTIRRLHSYSTQLDLPGAPGLDATGRTLELAEGSYLAYLDVWRRHVTAVEDPDLLESALGGPDTTTRLQTVAQVRLLNVPEGAVGDGCDLTWPELEERMAPSTGRMRARAVPEDDASSLCELPPRAGYRRLENQLYRVEVHEAGDLGGATFKWSRDNGSVVSRWLGQLSGTELQLAGTGRDAVLSFAPGEIAELSDDGRDLRGEPGELVEVVFAEGDVLEITSAVDFNDFGPGAKVRRWNCLAAETVEIAADNDGYLTIEDGVEIRFEAGSYRVGDYWLVPARTLQSDIDWPRDALERPEATSAEGINHSYARLGVLTVDNAGVVEIAADCRETFPTLTEICAEDICFDNTECAIPNADTVQDALDHLCEQHDHSFHNKHLHGWGVVCGLQVHCDHDDREQVVVRDGYALDCEGRDILLREQVELPLMEMVAELIDEAGGPILDDNGDGDVCLRIELDENHETRFVVDPFDPNEESMASRLQGTLVMDFYEKCILRLQEFLEEELDNADDDDGRCASGTKRLVAALTNIVAPALNPQAGHSIFVSEREHEMVVGFYERLRELLRSETYCAMFDNARPFPDYPLDDLGIRTIYGKGFHTRLRARPGSDEMYTVGAGINPVTARTRINRYDLNTSCLVEEIDPLAGGDTEGADTGVGAVEDVAFSPDGRRIYVIARARSNRDTFFRSGQIRQGNIVWGPLATLCGTHLVTLATTPADPDVVYAVGLQEEVDDGEEFSPGGLYRIDPNAPEDEPLPLQQFNAVGHLHISEQGRAAATATNGEADGSYDRVMLVDVPNGSIVAVISYEDPGTDDIAIQTRENRAQRNTVYAVIGDGNAKRIVAHSLDSGRPLNIGNRLAEAFIEDTTVRLQPTRSGLLLRSLEDNFSVRTLDPATFETVGTAVPMQVGPIAMALTQNREVAVLNFASNTILVAPESVFDPGFGFPHEALASYRRQALEAFVDLLAGFLQYLKDCACDLLMVDCPECDEDDLVYLGVISIRDRRVYKVCNFTKRRQVKTWPKVSYWASAIPIMPLLDSLLERFCCLILPDVFGRYEATEVEIVQHEEASNTGLKEFRGGVATTQAFDSSTKLNNINIGATDSVRLAGAGLAMPGGFSRAFTGRARPAMLADLGGLGALGGLAASPVGRLAANKINPLAPLMNALGSLGPRSRPRPVTADPAPQSRPPVSDDLRSEVRALADQLAARESEVAELRLQVQNQQSVRGELDELRGLISELRRD